MIFANGTRDDHLARAGDMCGIVSSEQLDVQSPQIISGSQVRVASSYAVSASHEKLRECAHSCSSNSNEMDWTIIVSARITQLGRPRISFMSTMLSMCRAISIAA